MNSSYLHHDCTVYAPEKLPRKMWRRVLEWVESPWQGFSKNMKPYWDRFSWSALSEDYGIVKLAIASAIEKSFTTQRSKYAHSEWDAWLPRGCHAIGRRCPLHRRQQLELEPRREHAFKSLFGFDDDDGKHNGSRKMTAFRRNSKLSSPSRPEESMNTRRRPTTNLGKLNVAKMLVVVNLDARLRTAWAVRYEPQMSANVSLWARCRCRPTARTTGCQCTGRRRWQDVSRNEKETLEGGIGGYHGKTSKDDVLDEAWWW